MADPQRGSDGFYHPADEDQIAALVAMAAQRRLQLRVRGSMHSVPASAITTDGFNGPKDPGPHINVQLDRFRAVRFSKDGTVATVQAGCHLGQDPQNPKSTLANGLLDQLDRRKPKGAALDDLGGITHQTVSGFLSTGSSGGSLRYSVEDNIQRIRLLDGTGRVHDLDPSHDDFDAAGVSMGLLGVILAVDVQPTVPRFCIQGQEAITTVDDCAIDLFGPGAGSRPSLERFLRETDYTRLMWWPQPQVNKMVVWQAKRIGWSEGFTRQPYQQIGKDGIDLSALPPDVAERLKELVRNVGASVLFNALELLKLANAHRAQLPTNLLGLASTVIADLTAGRINVLRQAKADTASLALQLVIDLYFTLLGNRTSNELAQSMFMKIFGSEADFERVWSPLIMNYLFVAADRDKPAPHTGQPQEFQDLAYTGLPMDNQISDLLVPTVFTELWIPIERTQAVMNDLKRFYDEGGYASTGTYACEIYGTKASRFWMSPAQGQDVLRIDVFWFGRNAEPPDRTFYPKFWRLLARHDFRAHWGKYLPPPESDQGVRYLQKRYPRWDDFMRVRDRYDPGQIFVTDYWRRHLDIARPG